MAADYEAPLDQLVLDLKFGAQLALAPLFGSLLAQAMRRQPPAAWPALLAPGERRANLRLAFAVPPASLDRVRGQHIGIIDDVITTGVTLDEIAATLKRAGAARVSCLAFARTPRR